MLTEEDAPIIDFPKDAGDYLADAVNLGLALSVFFAFGGMVCKPGEGDVKRLVNANL
jgi:hypothetical protein